MIHKPNSRFQNPENNFPKLKKINTSAILQVIKWPSFPQPCIPGIISKKPITLITHRGSNTPISATFRQADHTILHRQLFGEEKVNLYLIITKPGICFYFGDTSRRKNPKIDQLYPRKQLRKFGSIYIWFNYAVISNLQHCNETMIGVLFNPVLDSVWWWNKFVNKDHVFKLRKPRQ